MIKKRIPALLLSLALLLSVAVTLPAELPAEASSGPNRPFPQAGNTKFAVERTLPSSRTQSQMNNDVVLQFNKILQDFIVDPDPATAGNPDTFRMLLKHTGGTGSAASSVTTSESMGYGMYMLALMAGAENVSVGSNRLRDNLKSNLPQGLRDALGSREIDIKFYYDAMFRSLQQWPSFSITPRGQVSWDHSLDNQNRRTFLMAWQILQPSPGAPFESPATRDATSATDGDLDMAYSLLLAYDQWGSEEYLEWAKGMINDLWLVCVDSNSHHLRVGNWATSLTFRVGTRPSDFLLHQLKVFDQFSDHNWQLVINTCHEVIEQITSRQNPRNGLLPDFAILDRETGIWSPPTRRWLEGVNDGNYHFNACRTPWRMGIDVMFSGNTPTRDINKTLNDFMRKGAGGNFSEIRSASLDGTLRGMSGAAFSSPFLVTAAVHGDVAWMSNGWDYARNLPRRGDFYGDYINVLCMIAASGNEWSPSGPPAAGTAPNLNSAASWAHTHIQEAYDKGFIPETLQSRYSNNITRGEFVTLAMSWLRYKTGMTNDELLAQYADSEHLSRNFSDTNDPNILAAARLDITAGTTASTGGRPGVFGVDMQFDREQAAIMLMKICRIVGTFKEDTSAFGFTDLSAAQWMPEAINYVGNNDVMSGKGEGRFAPKDTFQRQESIIVFNKMG
jgi:hypothetical protein